MLVTQRSYIKDYIEYGFDITLKYNDEGNVTFTPQATGYVDAKNGPISIKMATDNSPSTVNFCARTLTLSANYFVAAGTYGNKIDTFVGN